MQVADDMKRANEAYLKAYENKHHPDSVARAKEWQLNYEEVVGRKDRDSFMARLDRKDHTYESITAERLQYMALQDTRDITGYGNFKKGDMM